MKYKFNPEIIKKNYNSLLTIKNIEDKELYNITLEYYDLFLKLINEEKINNKNNYKSSDLFQISKAILKGNINIKNLAEIIKENYNIEIERKELINLFKDLEKDIPDNIKSLTNLNIDLTTISDSKNLKYKKIEINIEEAKKKSYDLFKSINKDYINNLNYIYNNSLIHILSKNENKKFKTEDATYYDSFNNTPYIIIINNNTYEFFDTLNHELCHMIEYMKGAFDNDMFLLNETNAIFISFLTDYLSLENIESLKAFYNYYLFNKENYAILKAYNEIKQMNNLSTKNIKNNLINNLGVDYNLKTFFNSNISEVYVYFTSMIVALHLLEIYKEDQDKAYYLFNKSIKLNNPSYEDYFKMINFDPLNKDYVNNLINNYDNFFDKELTRKKLNN